MSINTPVEHTSNTKTQADEFVYQSGFGNDFETESLPGALPQQQNSPQRCAYGLYAEQLSGSPFTAPRGTNERSWLYRIQPSVCHSGEYNAAQYPLWLSAGTSKAVASPQQHRWNPQPLPKDKINFINGINTITIAGDVMAQSGMATHVYTATSDMVDDYCLNADGEMLIVPQLGSITVFTELGKMQVSPKEICVIPRGMMFKVTLSDGPVRGYICENYGAKFTLPDRGPIGANCLANPRDFKTPVACYEDKETPCVVHLKWCGQFYQTTIDHSPLDVVAWHGNYAPYKYDLAAFSPVGAILFDHPDPSIFTVLTAPSEEAGTANVDFVIFPPRWNVAENTFRPPWYHRNIMSEFMGLIEGKYDAKEAGFTPGGISLHNMMMPHGPDFSGFEKASTAELKPAKIENSLAFMFETRFPQQVTTSAIESPTLQKDYFKCWQGIARKFDGTIEGKS